MRKFLSMILATAMVLAMLPYSAMADGTVISVTAGPGYQADVNHTGMVVTPEINVVSGETPASYKYQWYAQNNRADEYILPWETGASITINSQLPRGYYLNFEVTPLDSSGNPIGDTVRSNHYIAISPMKGRTDSPELTAEQSAAYHDTPAEYTFEVDGVKFILLDRVWSGEYYVMMENSVKKGKFDDNYDSGSNFKFNPSDTNNIAYWLNNDFLAGNYIPDSVKTHITEEGWLFEGDGNWGEDTRTLKVGLLSYSEYIAYLGRFGLWMSGYDSSNPNSWEGWWLRTLSGNARVFASCKNGGNGSGGVMGKLYGRVSPNDGNYFVRPTFHLSADFFEDVRVSNPGAKVLEVLSECDSTDIEIEAGPGYQADVNHTGMVVTPTINYIRGPQPAGYKYQWYAENNSTHEEYILPWETGASITLASQVPIGWYLNFEVTPLDSAGNVIGDTVKAVHYISSSPMKGKTDTPSPTAEQSTAYTNTPAEYIFEVDGVKFILLDRLYNGEYYVMMENSVAKRQFDTDTSNGIKFDPTDSSNIAYWLNNDFWSGDTLPQSVKNYITSENWATTYDNRYGADNKTCRIGLLSYSEYLQYLGRFGFKLNSYTAENGWDAFWLRSTITNGKTQVYVSSENGTLGNILKYDYNSGAAFVRPTFRLSADFFENVKVDPATMGNKVKEILIEKYTRAQLGSIGYTKNEISNIGKQVNSFAVYDAGNNVKASGSTITAGSSVTAKAFVGSNNLLSPVMFFAVYNGTDLEGVQMLDKASADTTDGVTYYELTVPSPVAGKTYKAFLWDDLDNYMALRNAITLNCPTP